jgi:hypothetical protein
VQATKAAMTEYPESLSVAAAPSAESVPPDAVVPLGSVPLIRIVLVPLILATVMTLLFNPL